MREERTPKEHQIREKQPRRQEAMPVTCLQIKERIKESPSSFQIELQQNIHPKTGYKSLHTSAESSSPLTEALIFTPSLQTTVELTS
ncbi:hypothetical protein Bca4012_091127 [Brassica carinata]